MIPATTSKAMNECDGQVVSIRIDAEAIRVAPAPLVSVAAVTVIVISGVVLRDFLRGHHNLDLIDAVPGVFAVGDPDRIGSWMANGTSDDVRFQRRRLTKTSAVHATVVLRRSTRSNPARSIRCCI